MLTFGGNAPIFNLLGRGWIPHRVEFFWPLILLSCLPPLFSFGTSIVFELYVTLSWREKSVKERYHQNIVSLKFTYNYYLRLVAKLILKKLTKVTYTWRPPSIAEPHDRSTKFPKSCWTDFGTLHLTNNQVTWFESRICTLFYIIKYLNSAYGSINSHCTILRGTRPTP